MILIQDVPMMNVIISSWRMAIRLQQDPTLTVRDWAFSLLLGECGWKCRSILEKKLMPPPLLMPWKAQFPRWKSDPPRPPIMYMITSMSLQSCSSTCRHGLGSQSLFQLHESGLIIWKLALASWLKDGLLWLTRSEMGIASSTKCCLHSPGVIPDKWRKYWCVLSGTFYYGGSVENSYRQVARGYLALGSGNLLPPKIAISQPLDVPQQTTEFEV